MSLRNGFVADTDAKVERVEALLRSLTGIIAARVRIGPRGEIGEVHIVVSDDTDPAQAARNVQSALLARLGIHLDQGAISTSAAPSATGNGRGHRAVGATPAPRPPSGILAALATHGSATTDHRIRLDSLEIERRHSHRLHCRVTITHAAQIATGEAQSLDAPGISLELAARAAMDAVRTAGLNPTGTLEIDGLRQIEIAGREYILVAARVHLGRTIRYLAGVAAVEDLPEDAAALASLQAVERWLADRGHPAGHHPK